MKRERREEHICPVVAKSGMVSSCVYNEKCRYSHDLEAFKAQKPADLEGVCPFLSNEGPCPYGIACRYAGTHKDGNGEVAKSNGDKKNSEMNVLTKDVQRLLWKNKMNFPKADAVLKLLGLQVQGKKKRTGDNDNDFETDTNGLGDVDGNGCCKTESNTLDIPAEVMEEDFDKPDVADEARPPKKTNCSTDKTCDLPLNDGEILHEKEVVEQNEPIKNVADILEDNDKCLMLHPREKKKSLT